MKRTLWVNAAAIALMAGMSAASAQVGSGDQREQHMQNTPSGTTKGEERIKPGIHEKEPGAAVRNDQKEKGKLSQGQGQMDQLSPGGSNQEKMRRDKVQVQGQGQGQGQIQGQGQTDQMGQKERTTQQGTQKNQDMAGQGSQGSAKSVQLSSQQRSKIQATFKTQKVERVKNVDFDIRVGTRVPRTVRFYPLPIEIVEIVPEYQGYDYVLVGDEILIIDPDTFEIVAVLPA